MAPVMDGLWDSVREAEREWAVWLSTLRPWELHYVFARELDWHDDFVAGLADFSVFRAILDAEFAEYATENIEG